MDPSDHDVRHLGDGDPDGADVPAHANGGPPEGEGWLRPVLENSSEVVKIIDPDGTLRYASPAFGRVFGYDPDETVGEMNVLDHVHPDDLPRVLGETEKAISEGGVVTNRAEYRFRHRDGSWRWVESVGTYLLDDPQVGGVVVQTRDVTGRKAAEEALRRSEEGRLSILESITDAFFALDREWRFVYVNPRAQALFSNAREDLIGERIWEDPTFYPLYRRAVEEGRTVKFEALYPPSGLWYSARAYPSAVGLSVYLQDITERKKAEEHVRKAEERYRTLVEQIPAMTYIHVQRPGEFSGTTYVSPQVEDILGYTPEEYTADPEFWKSILHPEDRRRVLAHDDRTGQTGQEFHLEFRMLAKDGRTVWLGESGRLVDIEEDGRQVWHGVVFDITEPKRAEGALRDAEERYRTLVEQLPVVTYVDRADGSFDGVYTSPQIQDLLGYTPEEWRERKLWEKRLHPDDRGRILAADEGLEVHGEPFAEEYRLLARDDSVVWVREEAVLVRDGDGKPLFWQGVIHDVTESKHAEARLRESEERFRSTFEDAGIGMTLSTPDGRYLRANRSFCELLGYSDAELRGMTFHDITHPEDLEKDLELGHRLLAGEDRTFSMEKRYVRKDGSPVWVDLTVSMLRGPSGEPLYSVSQAQDVSDRKALEERLVRQAFHDPLTGLPNRSLFADRLAHALERTRRRGRSVAVLFMDLDNFKGVNDSLGHEAGDLLLTMVAQRLGGCLRPEDTLARFGGDEFVVLLEDVENSGDAVRAAKRITDELRRPFALEGRGLYVSASLGISFGPSHSEIPENLLRDADTAMYRAKETGRDYSVFDPAMHERAVGRLELENDLRRAVERDEFVVHYQPIVRLDNGAVRCVEALVRWDHPDRGLLKPDEFVPVAEESGLVVPMGEMVLAEACRQAKAWQEAHPRMPPLMMSVNLSARQLARPDLAETVEEVLGRTGFDGNSLGVDVTESVYVEALEGNTRSLDRLRALGVRISIDDFGTGYSSLSYLKRLPADALKIDKSFVTGLGEDVGDTAIVGMVVELAHTLGLEAVAEGVETEGQAEALREMGCDLGQGYRFSWPLRPEDVPGFLRG